MSVWRTGSKTILRLTLVILEERGNIVRIEQSGTFREKTKEV